MFTLDPTSEHFLGSIDILIKIIGGATALILFIIGIYRFKKDQLWKRREFVSKEIKEFVSDPMVRNIMYILDWEERYIKLFPYKETHEEQFVKVDHTLFISSLRYHKDVVRKENGERFNEKEVAIRDNFDHFLGYFERFEHFIKSKLIDPGEIEPYLIYWVRLIAENENLGISAAIIKFINKYYYTGSKELIIQLIGNIESEDILELESDPNILKDKIRLDEGRSNE